jgi:dTDP-4-dehydrorhamnose reductase/UDP-glucose 4-epimerase
VLREAVLRKPGGVINIGAGESLEIGRIALWIIEGFGSGRLIVEPSAECDEFQLDTERLKSEFGLNCGRERVADFSRELGRRLRRDMKRDVD